MGSLTGEPGPRPCPYCGRRIEPGLALGPSYGRGSPARHSSVAWHPPGLRSIADRVGEDIRYLAGTVGWAAAIWKVTRTPVLNVLIVLFCLILVALPATHLAVRLIAAAVLVIQLGRSLLFLWQVRRHAARR